MSDVPEFLQERATWSANTNDCEAYRKLYDEVQRLRYIIKLIPESALSEELSVLVARERKNDP